MDFETAKRSHRSSGRWHRPDDWGSPRSRIANGICWSRSCAARCLLCYAHPQPKTDPFATIIQRTVAVPEWRCLNSPRSPSGTPATRPKDQV